MKIGFATFEKIDNRVPGSVGSSRIRAQWLYDIWDEAEEYHIGKEYDAIVFQKVYWEKMMTDFNGIKVLDICDPDWLEGRDVIRYASLCDAVTTSSVPLKEYLEKLLDIPVVCIPDRVKLEEHKPVKKIHRSKIRSAVWFGYHQNSHYLDSTLPYLAKHGIDLCCVSDHAYRPSTDLEINIKHVKYSYPGIHEELIKHDLAILPDPSAKDLKGKFKSNNKVLTCWALGVPVARVPDEFERLLDVKEREKEATERMREIHDKWDVKYSVEEMKGLIDELFRSRKKS